MAIDPNKKMTFAEWMKVVQEEVNKPYQVKVQTSIEKKEGAKPKK